MLSKPSLESSWRVDGIIYPKYSELRAAKLSQRKKVYFDDFSDVANSTNGGWGVLPKGAPKVRGESELNALRMFVLLEERFGSGATVPTNVARRMTGLARMSFYRYLSLLERASLVEWRRGSMQYKSRRRREGRATLRPISEADRGSALRLAVRARRALQELRDAE